MSSGHVADSTDWLSTPLSGLAAVEAAFRCQVCKDFYNTPMITTCSHTFCSLCIRRALASDGKCPMCRAPEQEMKLRSNWSMEEAVEAFSKVRQVTLDLARNASSARASSPKRKAEEPTQSSSNEPEPKRIRTSARLSGKNRTYAEEQFETDRTEATEEVVVDAPPVIEIDDDYVPERDDGLVPCPVCQRRMKEWQVFKHLEECPGPGGQHRQEPNPHRQGESSASNSFAQAQRTQNKVMERLPAWNYSLLKEQALRKKMWELGLSSHGPRNLLERRHKEWITLWNANCDALRPKKRSELLHDLEVWERTQGGRVTMNRPIQNSEPSVKDKEFDGAMWAAKHDSSFKDLIAIAKRSREEAARKRETDKESTAAGPSTSATIDSTAADAGQAETQEQSHAEAEPNSVNNLQESTISPVLENQPNMVDDSVDRHYVLSGGFANPGVMGENPLGTNTGDLGVPYSQTGYPTS